MLLSLQLMNRPRWLGALVAVLAAAAVVYRGELGAWIAGDRGAVAVSGEPVAFYTCSMDPSVESDHPGNCPICGMALTPVTREDRASGVVRLAADARERIVLAVAPVATRPLRKRVVASGAVVEQAAAAAGRTSIIARVYRGDAREVRPDQPVAVAALEIPITQFLGAIVPPVAGDAPDALRIEVDNPDQLLRPGMHVEAEIDIDLPPRLVVPAQAVLYSGSRRIVFVDRGNGRFEAVTPKLGVQVAGFVEVIGGLASGDRVVVEGTFLVAAESRIRSDGSLWREPLAPGPIKPPSSRGGRP